MRQSNPCRPGSAAAAAHIGAAAGTILRIAHDAPARHGVSIPARRDEPMELLLDDDTEGDDGRLTGVERADIELQGTRGTIRRHGHDRAGRG